MIELSRARKSNSAEASCNRAVRATIPYPSEMLQNELAPMIPCSGDLAVSMTVWYGNDGLPIRGDKHGSGAARCVITAQRVMQ
jgi:hypothetical protein